MAYLKLIIDREAAEVQRLGDICFVRFAADVNARTSASPTAGIEASALIEWVADLLDAAQAGLAGRDREALEVVRRRCRERDRRGVAGVSGQPFGLGEHVVCARGGVAGERVDGDRFEAVGRLRQGLGQADAKVPDGRLIDL